MQQHPDISFLIKYLTIQIESYLISVVADVINVMLSFLGV